MENTMLTLVDAKRVVEAAVAKAESEGVAVSVVVVDGRGDLVALERMDTGKHFMNSFAEGKAQVSLLMGAPSAAFDEMLPGADSGIFQALNKATGGNLFFGQGAVPLTRDGQCIGAVGVSGATSAQDEDAATAGASAL